MNDALLASQIHDMALSCGYDDCGIIPIDYMGEFSDYLQKRIVDVPLSAFFYQAIGASGGTRDRFPWAKSVVVCTLWLGKYRFPASLQGKYAKNLFLSSDNEPCSAFRKSLEQLEVWFTEHGIRAEGGRRKAVWCEEHRTAAPRSHDGRAWDHSEEQFLLHRERLFHRTHRLCDRQVVHVGSHTCTEALFGKMRSLPEELSKRRAQRTFRRKSSGMRIISHDLRKGRINAWYGRRKMRRVDLWLRQLSGRLSLQSAS